MRIRSIVVFCVLAAAVPTVSLAGSFSAGINISEDAAPEKTGLRVYPGAELMVKNQGKDDSADIRFHFGSYGLKVVVAKLRSTDSPGKVAEFYRSELAQFGEVLDCSNPKSAETKRSRDEKSKVLHCGDDKPRKSGMLYKVGRKDDQRVVDIKPSGDGSEFSLVHVRVRGAD